MGNQYISITLCCLIFAGCAFTNVPDPGSMTEASMNADAFIFRDHDNIGLGGQMGNEADAGSPPQPDCVREADPSNNEVSDAGIDGMIDDVLDYGTQFEDLADAENDEGVSECDRTQDADSEPNAEATTDCPEAPILQDESCDESMPRLTH